MYGKPEKKVKADSGWQAFHVYILYASMWVPTKALTDKDWHTLLLFLAYYLNKYIATVHVYQ